MFCFPWPKKARNSYSQKRGLGNLIPAREGGGVLEAGTKNGTNRGRKVLGSQSVVKKMERSIRRGEQKEIRLQGAPQMKGGGGQYFLWEEPNSRNSTAEQCQVRDPSAPAIQQASPEGKTHHAPTKPGKCRISFIPGKKSPDARRKSSIRPTRSLASVNHIRGHDRGNRMARGVTNSL